jgi:hypothetical protein
MSKTSKTVVMVLVALGTIAVLDGTGVIGCQACKLRRAAMLAKLGLSDTGDE